MTKCILCVDRIYDETVPESERKPACVMTCPTNAHLFGDVHDPESEVSTAIREQGGNPLMPEWGTKPAIITCRAERWIFFAQANHPQNLCYQTIG